MASHAEDAPGLHATLSLFADLVMAERSVAETLRDRGEAPEALGRVIAEDERLSAAARLDIYAHMFFYRIHDVLWEYLPRTAAALGEDRFWNLLTGYLQRFPSRHPSLRFVGQDLATFARTTEPWASSWPWLAELVGLEWARLDVSDRADAEVLTLAMVQAQAADLPALGLRLVPASELVRTRHAVDETWRVIGEAGADDAAADEELPSPLASPAAEPRVLLVWRVGLEVRHRALAPLEATLVDELAQGLTFGRLCERLAESGPPDEAAATAVGLVSRWIADGILRAPV